MYIDAQHLFSNSQALTATANSTNLIDLGGDHNVGIGEPMAVVISVEVALDAGNADETYVFTVETDDNSSFSSAATIATKTATRGDAAGTKYVLPIPADTSAEQYLRVVYTLGGTSPSGTVSAFLIPQSMINNYVSYADGFTIS